MAWFEFAAALVVFLASHIAPTRPPVRRALVAALGARGFTALYSALSLAALAWLVVAAGRAPFIPIWSGVSSLRWAPILLMPAVCLLVALAAGAPNPLSFGGAHAEQFDPRRPGPARLARHPILLALALWSFAHLLATGDLAHIVLFGLFLAFAVIGMPVIDARRRRELGEAEWRRLSAATSAWPLLGLTRAPWRPALDRVAAIRLALGAAALLALIAAHPYVIGASPLPLPG